MELGHEVFVVIRPTCEWQERLEFLPKENILFASIRNSFGIFSAKKIAGFAQQNKIDIIHAHLARDYFPASLVCRLSKIRGFVLTRHVLFPMQAYYRFALKNLSAAIAVSAAVERELEKHFPKQKIFAIPNGIEIKERIAEEKQKLREAFRFENNIPFDAKFIGTIGELKELKGQEDFVLAAHTVAQKNPDVYFLLAGKDNSMDKNFRRKLKRLVKVFRLEERFLWLDWVENLESALYALDVFVSPSHSESFGLAILEALSAGCPVVATETEGAKEILGGGKYGKLTPIKDPVKLAATICQTLENPEAIDTLAGIAHAKGHFSLERMIAETEKLYKKISK